MQGAFVTGGSGFVGRHLVAELRRQGVAVRALARSPDAARTVGRAGAEVVTGELHDVAALQAGMAECDVVFHAAAIVADWGEARHFHRVNVEGTEAVLAAARGAGVPRLVHVSTDAVLAGPQPLVCVTEVTPRPAAPYGPYARTKGLAEERVLAANTAAMATVIVRPRFVWGRGDTSVLPKLEAAVRAHRFRWIDHGRYLTSSTHVANVVEGLVLAARRGTPGAIYFVTDGAPIEFRTFVTGLLETQGVRPGNRSLPRRVAWRLAGIVETCWGLLHLSITPPISRMVVKMMGEEVTLDDSRARRELGYVGGMTVEAGLREMSDAAGTPPEG